MIAQKIDCTMEKERPRGSDEGVLDIVKTAERILPDELRRYGTVEEH